MIDEKFVLVGILLNLFGSISYAWSTIKGKTKPNRVTWFLWAVVPLIAFSAQLKDGVGMQSILTFMVGFGPLMIFAASFVNKKAYWEISRLDIACGVLSVVAVVLWLLTGDGNLAIAFAISADLLAATPTLIKSYRFPETENYKPFLYSAISAVITLLTVDVWTFTTYGFALYILLIGVLLFGLIRFKLGLRLKAHFTSSAVK